MRCSFIFFDFPLVFLAPEFYKLDLGEIPAMIGGFALGPVAGVVIELVKILLKLVIKGTSTAFVGDLANFVVGCAFLVPASIVYHLKKTKKTARLALTVGTVCITIFGTVFNAFICFRLSPLFTDAPGRHYRNGQRDQSGNPRVWSFVLLAVAPLNLIKGVLISVPTMVLYKRISRVLLNVAQEDTGRRRSQPQA